MTRPPNDDDAWEQFTRTVKPISSQKKRLKLSEKKSEVPTKARFKNEINDADFLRENKNAPTAKREISASLYAGLNRSTAQKFKAGDYPIDYKIDLHGMTEEQAFLAVERGIGKSIRNGFRCVLIVTGKGKEGKGILKSRLPTWLSLPLFAPHIISLLPAAPKHGGAGAFYVVIRKKN